MTNPDAAAAPAPPYAELAAIYDFVMRHVDYVAWTNFVASLLRRHDLHPECLLELACGTGNATLALAGAGYRVAGYDASAAMVRVARAKAAERGVDVHFGVRDLRNLTGLGCYEAAVCLYDSFNYLMNLQQVRQALAQVHGVLAPGAIFIFDVCTEQNSMRHFRDVHDAEQGPGFVYSRRSYYVADERLQYNEFDIRREDGARMQETHVQRIYPCHDLIAAVDDGPLELIEAFDGFTLRPGTDRSDRVHFVLRRPA